MFPRRRVRSILLATVAAAFLVVAFHTRPMKWKPINMTSHRTLLIVTYMRSGSSLLADLLQQHPSVFYVFEPLRRLTFFLANGNKQMWLHGSKTREVQDQGSEILWNLDSWFDCRIEDIDLYSLGEKMFNEFGNKTRKYAQCLNFHEKATHWVRPIERCMHMLKDLCAQSSFRMVKTIRMDMKMVEKAMDSHPSLKVLFLVRDPRGVLQSRRRFGFASMELSGFKNDARQFCNEVESDLDLSEKLYLKYPDRFRRVSFEDLTLKPDVLLPELYSYAGIPYTSYATDYLQFSMKSGNKGPKNCHLCTTRENSQKITYSWRKHLPFEFAKSVDDGCRTLYKKLGYLELNTSTDLSDMNKPSWSPVINGGHLEDMTISVN